MATKTAHITLKEKQTDRVLKVVRSDVSNLARIDANERPWGGAIEMARKTANTTFKTNNFDRVLKVVRSGEDGSASTLGRGDGDSRTNRPHHHQDEPVPNKQGALLRITSLSLALMIVVFMEMTTVVVEANTKPHPTLVLNVPFQFTVGDRLLLPGTYSFEQLLDSAPGLNIVAIRSVDGGTYQAAVTTTTQAPAVPQISRLVFKRYGNSFFLSQVWTKGKLVGLLLYPSRGETRLAEQQAANEEVSVTALDSGAILASLVSSHRPTAHGQSGQ
jgi:hypothetical protein